MSHNSGCREEDYLVEQEQQTTGGLILAFMRALVPDKPPTRAQVLGAARIIIVVLVVLLALLLLLYGISRLFRIELMALLKVLAVPITVGAAVPLLNWLQKKRELHVENQRAQDEALQAYLDQMSQLLLDKDKPLRESKEGDAVRILARARTKEVLRKLDRHRKRNLLQFLHEACLIERKHRI
jgi:hypothetical protein